jgi:hypothetical protein
MKDARSTVTTLALAATATVAVVVPALFYVVAARGNAPDLSSLVLAPLVPGLVAVLVSRERWVTGVVVAGLALLAFYAALVAGAAGDSRASREAAAREYDEACNTGSSGFFVPPAVDTAFRDIGRLDSHHLHGPEAGGVLGCTMAVAGDVDPAFAAWREHLVGSGWRVVRDGSEVVVVRNRVRLTLFVAEGRTYLNAARAGADDCEAGRIVAVASTSSPDVEIASPACS